MAEAKRNRARYAEQKIARERLDPWCGGPHVGVTAVHEGGHPIGRYMVADILGHPIEHAVTAIDMGDVLPKGFRGVPKNRMIEQTATIVAAFLRKNPSSRDRGSRTHLDRQRGAIPTRSTEDTTAFLGSRRKATNPADVREPTPATAATKNE